MFVASLIFNILEHFWVTPRPARLVALHIPFRPFVHNDVFHIFLYTLFIMSFLGGPECSTAGNPLTQFTKHVQNDNTLQRDRLVGRGPGGLEEGMRSRIAPNTSDQVSTVACFPRRGC